MIELDKSDKRLIFHLSGELGDSLNPYQELAAKVGLAEDEVLTRIKSLTAAGIIRRLGATLWHQRSGFVANAMIVFRLPDHRVEECGQKLAAKPWISHCYQRKTGPGWPFNLYAMTHAQSRAELLQRAEQMAQDCQAEEWRMLESIKELKKASLRYFPECENTIING